MAQSEDVERFLTSSQTARTISVPLSVVLRRSQKRVRDLVDIKGQGTMTVEAPDTDRCALQAGGEVVAYGKIIRKRGRSFLKIMEVCDAENEAG